MTDQTHKQVGHPAILKWRFFVLAFIFLGIPVHAALTVDPPLSNTESDVGKTVIPAGSTKTQVLSFQLTAAAGNTDLLGEITLTNSGTVQFGRAGISHIYVYVESGGTSGSTFDPNTDLLVGERGFNEDTTSDPQTIAVNDNGGVNGVTIGDGANKRFYVVYDVASSVGLGLDAKATLTDIKTFGNSPVSLDLAGLTKRDRSITISGIRVSQTVVAPLAIVPGQTNIKMIKLGLNMIGETLKAGPQSNISLKIRNSAGNFGYSISNVSLIHDQNNNGVPDETPFLSLKNTEMSSAGNAGELDFAISSSATERSWFTFDQTNTTYNIYVIYDMDSSVQVTSDTKVYAQISGFTATGDLSGAKVTGINLPTNFARSQVVGLSYADVTANIPQNENGRNFFGPSTTVPILKFKLIGENTPVTVNSITIQNTGTVKYVTTINDTKGVTRVRLYEDTNKNGEYDGVGYGDTIIGDLKLNLGTGSNEAAKATIPIRYNGNAVGLLVPSSDTKVRNYKTVFVVYDLGKSIAADTYTTANITTYVNAGILEVTGSSSVAIVPITLSGTLPAIANPPARLYIVKPNVYIGIDGVDGETPRPVVSLAPPRVYCGQTKVPMLYIPMQVNTSVPSAAILIKNALSTFKTDNSGVSKVWIYKDINDNKKLDSEDVLWGATSEYFTGTNSPTQLVQLPNVDIDRGNQNLLVLYDIGQVADTQDTDSIAAQINNIVSYANVGVVMGGEMPQPKHSATTKVVKFPLSIKSVSVSSFSSPITNATGTFQVSIVVHNSDSAALTVDALSPRVYKTLISGQDITYEFSVAPRDSFPAVVSAGTDRTFTFDLNPSKLLSSGVFVFDAQLNSYVTQVSASGNITTTNNMVVLSRYRTSGENWIPSTGAANSESITGTAITAVNGWDLPNYVELLKYGTSANLKVMRNQDAIPMYSEIWVYLRDKGRMIDESSLRVFLSGRELKASAQLPVESGSTTVAAQYSYDRDYGIIKVKSDQIVADGVLRLMASDINKQSLSPAEITFYVSKSVQIHGFYIYPSPAKPGDSIKFAFRLAGSTPSDIKLYVFNSIGQRIYTAAFDSVPVGYNELTWNGNSDVSDNYVGPGVYFSKIMATDGDGNKAQAITKWAVKW